MDSMTEMFYDESNEIFQDMRRSLLMDAGSSSYGQEVVMSIFRSVHTLKADSTMMLYENMASVSRILESLLYCFRGQGRKITDKERFKEIICEYLDFFEKETDKLAHGDVPHGSAASLEEKINQYIAEVKAESGGEEEKEAPAEKEKPKRQVYYIPSAQEEKPEQKKDGEDVAATRQHKKKYMISETERDKILHSIRSLVRINSSLEYALVGLDNGIFSREQLNKLREIEEDLTAVKKYLANTDFVPVARKLEIVVDEMSQKLGKPVKLLVKGEETLVEREMREKISSALIHIVRNAVDHGIEDEETRERLGKSPMGLIKLKFSTEDGMLKISVKDDGCGINTAKVLKSAKERGLLTKPEEEYSEREITSLILINGLSTAKEDGDYSGRGVGMDVINHNVRELGGKLKISSSEGIGTTITMKF